MKTVIDEKGCNDSSKNLAMALRHKCYPGSYLKYNLQRLKIDATH